MSAIAHAPLHAPRTMLAVAVVIAEIAVALTVAIGGGFTPWHVVAGAGIAGFATIVVVARSDLAMGAKSALIAAILTTILALAAAQDAFGLRRVDAAVAAATRTAGDADRAAASTVAAPTAIALHGSGDREADALAADLGAAIGALPASAPRIEGTVSVDTAIGSAGATMTWSVARGADSRWCGTLRVSGSDRSIALDRFRTAIAAAVAASRDGAVACF